MPDFLNLSTLEKSNDEVQKTLKPITETGAGNTKKAWLADIATLFGGGIVLLGTAFAFIARVSFSAGISVRQQVANTGFLLLTSIAMVALMRPFGNRKGKETKAHETAERAVKENVSEIIEKKYAFLTTRYAREWERTEYEEAVGRIITPYNITLDEYSRYSLYQVDEMKQRFPNLTELQLSAIETAKKIKKQKYDEYYLTTVNQTMHRATSPTSAKDTAVWNAFLFAKNFITAIISAVFVASVSFDIIVNPSLSVVFLCAVKIFTLIISGVFAFLSGFSLYANRDTEWLNAKAIEQKKFIKWCEEEISKGKATAEPSTTTFENLETEKTE